MAGVLSSCLPVAMRMVGDAIRLDSQNCKKEAYCQYLSCCIYISQILKDDAWNKNIRLAYNKDSTKLFKLMQQCQERALTIISSEGSQPMSSPTSSPVVSHSIPVPSDNQYRPLDSSSTPPGRPGMGAVRTSSGHLLNFPSPPSSSLTTGSLTNSMKTCPRSNNQERRMMGHHLIVARVNTNNTDKTLTYLRRMSENLQIAKAREEAIRKKVWERQQRLQQEANRRFASVSVDSKEEQEQRALYTKILEFEQDVLWPRQLRAKLKEFPEDASLIKHIIDKIFSSKDHPLKQFLLQYQYNVYWKLHPLLKDVHFPNEKNFDSGKEEDMTKNTRTTEAVSCLLDKDKNYNKDFSQDKQSINQNGDPIEKENDNAEKLTFDRSSDLKEYSQKLEVSKKFKDNTCSNNQHKNDAHLNNRCVDKIQDNNSNSDCENNHGAFLQEDVKAIISSVMEGILEEVTMSEFKPVANDEEKDCLMVEIEKGSDSTVDTGDNGNKLNVSDESTKLPRKHAGNTYASQINEGSSTTTIVNSSNKEINKNRNLPRIKSFDVDSEFESLEDDMFDMENNGSEEEVENTSSKQSTLPKSTKEGTTLILGEKKQDDSTEDTEDAESRSQNGICQKQSEQKLSYEEDLELTRKLLNEIFVDMRFFLEKLKGFIILAYEELATPVGHDQCYAAVEYPFFKPLWPLLLGVLRRVNFDKELSLGGVITKRIHNTPAEIGVVDRLCLNDEESVKLTGNHYPYQSAVDLLQKVATSYCPLEKLDYIVHVLRSICQCVEDYWETKGKARHCPETSMGCDDILPVLTYVIVQSGMAQLVSECVAMEEFIPEGYLMGEEGYCLTTLQTAISYLTNLDSSSSQPLEEKPYCPS